MDTIRINRVADELGVTPRHVLRLAKRNGIELYYGKQNAASVTRGDADRLIREYVPQRVAAKNVVDDEKLVGLGYFYIIQLIPEENPNRIKVGYTDSLEQRLSDHRTTNPTLQLVKAWPCRRSWESAAIASITREGCQRIGGEVYEGDYQGFAARAHAFFALMPDYEDAQQG